MTGEEVKAKLAEIKKKQQDLSRQHDALQHEAITLMEQCPHNERRPYRACGVETNVCIFCGDEVHVRDYNLHINY